MFPFGSPPPVLPPAYTHLVDNRAVHFDIDNYHQPSNLDHPNNQPPEGNTYKTYIDYNCDELFVKPEELEDPSENEPDSKTVQSYF